MAEFNLIPYPSALRPKQGFFILDQDTIICPDSDNLANAEILQGFLRPATGFPFETRPSVQPGQKLISLELKKEFSKLGNEGYHLSISEKEIHLSASTTAGIFYAIQTLRQLLPAEMESETIIHGPEWKLPCVEIEDSPKYSWRGFMLDEARHFQGIKTVKKMLEHMALLKLNRFHWHLTDDQGWRIEIKQYPRLAQIGGKRAGTVVRNPYLSKKHNQIPHLGFYTQQEIQEVVAYAAERHIMVIPEIEMPGHSMAALAAYPEFSCTGGPFEVPTGWGIFPDIYCAGKQETYTFLENVLSEVINLFPAPYIHIGGDEAPKRRWKACPDCQKMIADNNLVNEHALQVYLTNHIADFARKHAKRIIFWSDSFDQDIDPDAIVHFWIGNRKEVLASVQQGRELISSPYLHTYLDQTHNTIPMKKAIQFDPTFDPQLIGAEGQVLGFEGLLWGEWLPNFRRVEYQAFPRLLALAEAGWYPRKNNDSFQARLEKFLPRLDLMDIGYAPLRDMRPSYWEKLLRFFQIPMPKKGISRPVVEDEMQKNLVEIPLNLSGKLFRSPMPFAAFDFEGTTFQEFVDSEVSTVVMLVEEGESFHYTNMDLKQLYQDNQMKVIHFPIMDFDTPEDVEEFNTILYQVEDLCKSGENVAVHCFAGRGRTGMFIAMLVRLTTGMEGQQAINYIRQYFPAIETAAQEQMVLKLELGDGEENPD